VRNSKFLLLLIFGLLFGCASTSTVLSDYDDTIDFNTYNTFEICMDDLFVENTNYPNYDNNAVRNIIAKEIENQMKDRGHITNVQSPQLQSGFRIVIEEKASTFTNCDVQNEYIYWKECTIHTVKYTEETLVVYVSDMERNQVIWLAFRTCNLNRPKKALVPYVQKIVESLFNTYPLK
jgi:hypothetical protein